MAAFVSELLPRTLDPTIPWKSIDYGSKQQLLARLPQRLIGYSRIQAPYRPLSLVLIDRDDDDCVALKGRLEAACANASLLTISTRTASGAFDVVNRIVIEELEAWFFGDGVALEQGWQGSQRHLARAAYREPDAISGGTHEAMLRVLQLAGHLKGAQ